MSGSPCSLSARGRSPHGRSATRTGAAKVTIAGYMYGLVPCSSSSSSSWPRLHACEWVNT
eukprot:368471-Prymnesium_polylepis.1